MGQKRGGKEKAAAELNLRKIKTTIRQTLNKMTGLETCINAHPTEEEKALEASKDKTEWENLCQVSAPAKKKLSAFIEHFEDFVERYAKDLGVGSSPLPLLALGSFEIGKLAIEFDEEDFEDFFEDFYELLPPHCWTSVLASHVISLVIKNVPLDYLLPALADICIKHNSFYFATEIMKAFFMIARPVKKEEFSWALSKMKKIKCRGNWMRFLAEYVVTYELEKPFMFESLDVDGSGLQVAKLILSYPLYREFDFRKSGLAVDYLVKHCCRKRHIRAKKEECCCFSILVKEGELLLNLDVSSLDPDVMFSLYFACLLGGEGDSKEYEEDLLRKLAEVLDFVDPSLQDILSPFNIEQIHAIAIQAEGISLGNLGSTLLVYLINTLRHGERDSHEENLQCAGSSEDIIALYEQDLSRIQKSLCSNPTWRYEVIADEWIKATPLPSKSSKVATQPLDKDQPKSGTPLHISSKRRISLSSAGPSSVLNGKTPYRTNRIDSLRSGAEDDDPLTAAFSVERIRLALYEKQRLKQAYRLGATPKSNGSSNSSFGHHFQGGSASPMIQESPMMAHSSSRMGFIRPPLGGAPVAVLKVKGVNVSTLGRHGRFLDTSEADVETVEKKMKLSVEEMSVSADENRVPFPCMNKSGCMDLESSDPLVQMDSVSRHYVPSHHDIVESEDELLL